MSHLQQVLFSLGILVGLTAEVSGESTREKTLYLNSETHCDIAKLSETENFFSVDENTVFNVQIERPESRSGTATFRQCHLVFRSSRTMGRLCVMQRHLTFDSCHFRLALYDGTPQNDGKIAPNKYLPPIVQSSWREESRRRNTSSPFMSKRSAQTADCDRGLMGAEWCTGGGFLTVGLTRMGNKAHMQTMDVDLLVYHISMYMDSLPYCGSHLELDNSKVTVSNLDPHRKVRSTVFHQCVLTFASSRAEENRSVCVEPLMAEKPSCALNYTLEVDELGQRGPPVPSFVRAMRTYERPLPRRQWEQAIYRGLNSPEPQPQSAECDPTSHAYLEILVE
ncbi:hypothetical protein BaRGS_00038205 [Batillaria attramentaria]|uniref:Uncharacterized protein n=1 Tax=Batillaria attramentaria TaxID=370345 RepID=A0ABD0J6Q0_9CAEN